MVGFLGPHPEIKHTVREEDEEEDLCLTQRTAEIPKERSVALVRQLSVVGLGHSAAAVGLSHI